MGILDSLTASSEAAYSLRKLLTAYSGFVITIRRTGDNLQGDVAFDGDTITMSSMVTPTSGDPTLITLNSFSSGVSCYIIKIYSQIGTFHVTQTTTTSQPKIIDAITGLLEDENNNPAPTYDGTDMLTSGAFSLTQPFTFNMVGRGTVDNKIFISGNTDDVNIGILKTSGLNFTSAGNVLNNTPYGSVLNTQIVVTSLLNGANSSICTNLNLNTGNAGTNNITSGIRIGNNISTKYAVGYIQESIFFDSDIGTTDRELLEADQDAYYIDPPAGITIDHTAGTLNMPVTTHTVTAIASVPINITHIAGTLNMPSTTHTVTATENINITHIAGTLNFPSTTHTVTAVGEVSIEHTAGTLNLPSNTHTITATQNVSIAHVTGTLNMPSVTHTITAGASASINHVAGTFNMPSVTHTVTIASVVTGLTTDIKSILTRINPTIYRNDKPDKPGNLMVIYQTGGQPALHAMGVQPPSLEKPTFQVLIRNTSHDTAELQATQVKNILDGLTKLTINNTRYEVIFLEGDIIHLGRDDRERTQFTLNFVAWIKRTIVDTSTWLLNADTQPFTGSNYVWDDTAVWDDNNVWKD